MISFIPVRPRRYLPFHAQRLHEKHSTWPNTKVEQRSNSPTRRQHCPGQKQRSRSLQAMEAWFRSLWWFPCQYWRLHSSPFFPTVTCADRSCSNGWLSHGARNKKMRSSTRNHSFADHGPTSSWISYIQLFCNYWHRYILCLEGYNILVHVCRLQQIQAQILLQHKYFSVIVLIPTNKYLLRSILCTQ